MWNGVSELGEAMKRYSIGSDGAAPTPRRFISVLTSSISWRYSSLNDASVSGWRTMTYESEVRMRSMVSSMVSPLRRSRWARSKSSDLSSLPLE